MPEEGRLTVSGEPWISQLLPPVSNPMASTLIGTDSAAVVGSGITRKMDVIVGLPLVSENVATEASNGIITKGTGFESAPFGPGFRT
jgi:hypothetical protein